jgi:multiple sugar transport system ATP-binding protein
MNIRYLEVSKEFGRTTVVDRLSLEIADGEMMVLLGPSGCGKTTSLRMLAGLEGVSRGAIYIGPRRVDGVPARDRDVAMVFQNYALYPHMTVRENIGYPLRVRGEQRGHIDDQVIRVAEKLEIARHLDRRPRELSGGERQRVALARAIVRRPVAFLMDEPLSNLDARLRLEMRGELKRLQRELRTTTVYVTHDQAEAMTLAHRIAVLRAGRLEQVGTPAELYRRPGNRFVAGFLGSPPMNFLAGEAADGTFVFGGGRIPFAPGVGPGRAGAVVAGFRPEAASVARRGGAGAIEGAVYVTEQMGNETFVFVRCGRDVVTVRAEADFQAEIGDRLTLEISPAELHFFDPDSGAAVGR